MQTICADQIALKALNEALNRSFADYEIPTFLSYEQFINLIKRNSYDARYSYCILNDEGEAVGLSISGRRSKDSVDVFYDIATGIDKDYRGKHLGDELIKAIGQKIAASGGGAYYLEVLKDNKAALKLYERNGFKIKREMICFKGVKEELKTLKNSLDLKLKKFDDETLADDLSDRPSWQNAAISLVSAGHYSIASLNDGYIIFDPVTSEIARLKADDHETYQKLISFGISKCLKDVIRMINVDITLPLVRYLKESGFKEEVRQYEMVKQIAFNK